MTVCVDALGVPIGIPEAYRDDYAGFATSPESPHVVLDLVEAPAFTGTFTRAVVDRTTMLCCHAGVVASAAGAIVIPGASGLGKSTLVAALVQAGFGYMSDEVMALDPTDGTIRSFTRPLTLDARSLALLTVSAGQRTPYDGEWAIPGHLLGGLGPDRAAVAAVVLAMRTGQPAHLVRTAASDAVAALIPQSFNHYRNPRESLAAIAGLVRASTVYRTEYCDATRMALQMAEEFGPAM